MLLVEKSSEGTSVPIGALPAPILFLGPQGSGLCLLRRSGEICDGGNIEANGVATVEAAKACGIDRDEPLMAERCEEAPVVGVGVAKVGVRDLEGTAADYALEAQVPALARFVEDDDGRGIEVHAASMRGRSPSRPLWMTEVVVVEPRSVVGGDCCRFG